MTVKTQKGGSLQYFVKDSMTVDEYRMKNNGGFPPQDPKTQKRIQILDFLTQNCDRHSNNIMYHPQSGRYIAIDNGYAFDKEYCNHPKSKKPIFQKQFCEEKDVVEKLPNLLREDTGFLQKERSNFENAAFQKFIRKEITKRYDEIEEKSWSSAEYLLNRKAEEVSYEKEKLKKDHKKIYLQDALNDISAFKNRVKFFIESCKKSSESSKNSKVGRP